MSGFSGTCLGTAKSRKTLTGHSETRKTEDGTTKAGVATGDAPVADCEARFARALIARGVPPVRARKDARRVVRLALSDLPERTRRYRARCITRKALQAAVLA